MWPLPSWAENILDEFAFLILGILFCFISQIAFFSPSLKKKLKKGDSPQQGQSAKKT